MRDKKVSIIIKLLSAQRKLTHSRKTRIVSVPARNTAATRISFSSRICSSNKTALNPEMTPELLIEYNSFSHSQNGLTFGNGVHLRDGFDKRQDLQRVVDIVPSFPRGLLHDSRVHFFPSLIASSEIVLWEGQRIDSCWRFVTHGFWIPSVQWKRGG